MVQRCSIFASYSDSGIQIPARTSWIKIGCDKDILNKDLWCPVQVNGSMDTAMPPVVLILDIAGVTVLDDLQR